MTKNFAITGVGGYIAPRHLRAIKDTGNRVAAAVDVKDSVGVLDQYAFDVRFFTEVERFDRHLEKLKRGPEHERIHFLTVCTPNYLHDAHCRLGLRVGADVICEKPLVINPWNLQPLQELEAETGRRIYTILQLRVHPKLIELRERLARERPGRPHEVVLSYVTARGAWYDVSWKGSIEKSGGVSTNIGIHFFDLLGWLFGDVESSAVHLRQPRRMAGSIRLERANVRWFLSVEASDLPTPPVPGQRSTHRSITVDGQELEFSEGFTDLHTLSYRDVLGGGGFGIEEVRPSIELAHRIRTEDVESPRSGEAHPKLSG